MTYLHHNALGRTISTSEEFVFWQTREKKLGLGSIYHVSTKLIQSSIWRGTSKLAKGPLRNRLRFLDSVSAGIANVTYRLDEYNDLPLEQITDTVTAIMREVL